MARPYTSLPRGAKRCLNQMAADGLLSETRAANALGIPHDQFRAVIRDNPEAKRLWEDALSIERDAVLEAMYQKAVDGDVSAQRTLLAVRHGLSEKAPQGATGGVSVVFNLPAAQSPAEYLKALQVTTQDALPHASNG